MTTIAKLYTAGLDWGQCPFHDWHGQEMRQDRLQLAVVRLVEEPGGQIHDLRMCTRCAQLFAQALPPLIALGRVQAMIDRGPGPRPTTGGGGSEGDDR